MPRFENDTRTNLHFMQSDASFGRWLAAANPGKNNLRPTIFVSPYIQNTQQLGHAFLAVTSPPVMLPNIVQF